MELDNHVRPRARRQGCNLTRVHAVRVSRGVSPHMTQGGYTNEDFLIRVTDAEPFKIFPQIFK